MYRLRKRISIWILLFIQILVILSYFYFEIEKNLNTNNKISFIANGNKKQYEKTYHTKDDRIELDTVTSNNHFINFNSSLCFINGTDLQSMQRKDEINWKCECLQGWHGTDCGQPEVIWRAFLTYRKPMRIKGPRPVQRRLIYLFTMKELNEFIVDMRIRELERIVDLFVIYETEQSNYVSTKLSNGFVKEFHKKILYVKMQHNENLWEIVEKTIELKSDDIIMISNLGEIPNLFALNYLKFYNNWPDGVRFRLRWNVFGFFWLHPSTTVIMGGACTVSHLRETLNKNLSLLTNLKTGMILGDLNHFGGWYCEYCNDAAQIVKNLPETIIDLDKNDKIDMNYIEDIIENGMYVDGKTELKRSRKYENYFAPFYAIKNNWRYDFLFTNFYSKMDYYEG